ncbi:MAG: 5'-3' exonuclease, partial [Lachnospiraceae bacterium]
MPDRLYLIDGHSILNRAFYGVPDLTNSEGIHTNAVYGFLNILFKVIEEEQPEYLGVAFDLPEPTFRHKMYPEYKGTRKKPAPEFRQQVPIIKEVLRAMGIKCISKGGYEADDILGTVSKQGERQGMNVTVISGDRDLLQLASKNITIRIPKTIGGNNVVEEYDEKAVIDKYEVTPQEFIDVKALMGDSSDNIPGLPGVGEKTAVKIIKIYGCIENAFEHASEIKPPRAGKAMLEHYDLAVMSKQLAAIDTNVELDLALEDLKAHDYLTQEAYQLFKKLGFKQLSLKFNKDNESDGETVEFEMIGSRETADKIFSELSGDRIAFSAVDIGEKSVFSLSLDKTYVFVL